MPLSDSKFTASSSTRDSATPATSAKRLTAEDKAKLRTALHPERGHVAIEGLPDYVSYVEPDTGLRRQGWLISAFRGIAKIEIGDGAYAHVPEEAIEREDWNDRVAHSEEVRAEIKEALGLGTRKIRADLYETRQPIPLGPDSAQDYSLTLRYQAILGLPSEDDVRNYVFQRYPGCRILDADDSHHREGLLNLIIHRDAQSEKWNSGYNHPGVSNEEMGGSQDLGELPSGTGAGFSFTDDGNDVDRSIGHQAEMTGVAGGELIETLAPPNSDSSGSGGMTTNAEVEVEAAAPIPNAMKDTRREEERYKKEEDDNRRMVERRKELRRMGPQLPAGNVVPVVKGRPLSPTAVTAQLQKQRPVGEVARALIENPDDVAKSLTRQMVESFARSGGFDDVISSGGMIDGQRIVESAIRSTAQGNQALWRKVSDYVASHGINMAKSPAFEPGQEGQEGPPGQPGQPEEATEAHDVLSPEFSDHVNEEGQAPNSAPPPAVPPPGPEEWTDQDKERFIELDNLTNANMDEIKEREDLFKKWERTHSGKSARKTPKMSKNQFDKISRRLEKSATSTMSPHGTPELNRRYPDRHDNRDSYKMRPSERTVFAAMRLDKIASEGDYLSLRVVWDPEIFSEETGSTAIRQTVTSFVKGWASQIDRHKDPGATGKPHFVSFDRDAGRATLKMAAQFAKNWPMSIMTVGDDTSNFGGNY